MYLTNYKSVALPLPELIGVSKNWGCPCLCPHKGMPYWGWYRSKYRWRVPIGSPYILFLYQHSFARNFRLHFWVGVANPQSWGRGGRMGSGMIPFERAFVSSYRPSTFPLSLRVSEILPLLFSITPLFHTPPLVSPKFPYVLLGVRRSPYGSMLGWLRGQLVSKISNLCDHKPPTSQTDGRTDGRHAITIPRFALKCIAR